jgi:hypothetical protein
MSQNKLTRLEEATDQSLRVTLKEAEKAIICGEYEIAQRFLQKASNVAAFADFMAESWSQSHGVPLPLWTYREKVDETFYTLIHLASQLLYTGQPRPEA